jgi:1-acyl-sn-glycerol-3-phosphate acyltransferase
MIPSLILLATYILLGLPVALIFVPWTLITGHPMPLFRASYFVVRTGLKFAGVRVTLIGAENIPPNVACIFMSNHVSNLDPPILLPLIPGQVSVFLKQSLMKIPVLGYAMSLVDFIPVNRDGTAETAKENGRLAKLVLDKGIHIATFVEGTRSRDGHLLPFKKGPFYLAMETNAPCIPVTILGTHAMMPKGTLRTTPGSAIVTFHSPIYPSAMKDRDALMKAVRDSIESSLPASLKS